jgi:hypothetical protein
MNDGRNLRLPVTLPLGAGQEAAKSVAQKWDTIDDQIYEVEARGLVSREKPQFVCPELTADMLTTTDSKNYTETYVHLNAWFGYASEIYAQVKATVLQFENMKDILEAEGRKVAREGAEAVAEKTKKPTKEELEDRMLLNPEYQEVKLKLQRYQQSELLFKAKLESIERSLRVISRQVEIRRLDLDQTRNGGNMPNRGYTGGGRFGAPDNG